eukprot:1677564-Alexandrium_andersonii.AAC.1
MRATKSPLLDAEGTARSGKTARDKCKCLVREAVTPEARPMSSWDAAHPALMCKQQARGSSNGCEAMCPGLRVLPT